MSRLLLCSFGGLMGQKHEWGMLEAICVLVFLVAVVLF